MTVASSNGVQSHKLARLVPLLQSPESVDLDLVDILPHFNASLNSLSGLLLVVGYLLIKKNQEAAHKWTMLSAFAVSTFFLGSYLLYHYLLGGSRHFPADAGAVRYVYLAILASHVILAASVPFLALTVIYFGLRDQRARHRRWARWTFPIWLYVSATGVVVYVMLYHLYAA